MLGKPIRTISMKHTGLSALQFYTFVPHFREDRNRMRPSFFLGFVKLLQAVPGRGKLGICRSWHFGQR